MSNSNGNIHEEQRLKHNKHTIHKSYNLRKKIRKFSTSMEQSNYD
jgi:hypothetical protein